MFSRSSIKITHRNVNHLSTPTCPSSSSSPHHGLHHSRLLFSHRRHHHQPLSLQLHACSSTSLSSATTKPLHALTITSGSAPPISVHNSLISAYAFSGELSTARMMFDRMPHRNVVSYNSIIAAYSRNGHVGESFELFSQMMASGIGPTQFTFGGILSSASFELCHGLQLHPLILKTGLLHAGPFSGTALLGLYGRHGRLDDALKLFREIRDPSVATWNSMIAELARRGLLVDSMFLFRELLRTGIGRSEYSFLGVISTVNSSDGSECGEQVHGLAIRTGVDSYVVVANALVNMYSDCFGTYVAERLFIGMTARDLVSWNTMIAVFSKNERLDRALELYLMMSLDGFLPSESTFASVLIACTGSSMPEFGEFIHAKTIKLNLDTGDFVSSSLVDFYAKCKSLDNARALFNEIPKKNIVSWNALISGYSNKGSRTSVVLLQEMVRLGFRPNEFSLSSVLKWSYALELLQLHSLIIRMGYDGNEYVSTAIIAAYDSQGNIYDALAFATASAPSSVASANVIGGLYNRSSRYQETQKLLSNLQEADIVSWNVLITACARNGDYEEAFLLFKRMQNVVGPPDNYTAVSLLSICTKQNSLNLGSLLHGLMLKINFESFDVFAHNVLLDMYAKCGSLEGSLRVFEEMGERNLISWTALISALGLHGRAHESLMKFKQMEWEGFRPDRITFIAVLSACRHGGLANEGMSLFRCMKSDHGIEPEMDHYISVVDLLCRYGRLKEAENVISSMPFQPNAAIWRSFLEGCRRFGKTDV